MRCYHCERELQWQSELNLKDFDCDVNMYVPVIVTFLRCNHCPCDVEVKYRLPLEYHSDTEIEIDQDGDSGSDMESASI